MRGGGGGGTDENTWREVDDVTHLVLLWISTRAEDGIGELLYGGAAITYALNTLLNLMGGGGGGRDGSLITRSRPGID